MIPYQICMACSIELVFCARLFSSKFSNITKKNYFKNEQKKRLGQTNNDAKI